MRLTTLCLLLTACGDKDTETGVSDTDSPGDDTSEQDTEEMEGFPNTSCADYADPCVQIAAGDAEALQETSNLLVDGQTIVLAEGTWSMDNQVTFRSADRVSLIGQGMDLTTLDFAEEKVQTNGVDAISDGFLIQGLTVIDAKKDGIRVEDSEGITFRDVRATWRNKESSENGAYGLYPVSSSDVLIEDCEAHNSADAGIYVGQVQRTIVRNNLATGNVAGIEIENTQYADVYGNTATGNTGGLLIFDLPGNPIIGRDIWVHDNTVTDNNTPNFAPGGTVGSIPAGTGTIVLASRRVVVENNTYANNNTADIAIINGLAIEGSLDSWAISEGDLVGDIDGLDLDVGEGVVYNFSTRDVLVSANSHSGSGTDPDLDDVVNRPIGTIVGLVYRDSGFPVDDVLYDAINESSFSATETSGNSNDNRICVGTNSGGTYASLDLESLAAKMENFELPQISDVYRPEAPFAPFDCAELEGGDIPKIELGG
ncbi:MAG: parallel beta-helix domain-containing protein [Myxococcota bacterium]|nr:parallel beta-helix domain-containing protein [Myxococcota bacterium]